MARHATAPVYTPHVVRQGHVAARPWDEFVLGLRALPPIKRDYVLRHAMAILAATEPSLNTGSAEALLIELGSRRGEWVTVEEIMRVYGMTRRTFIDALFRLRRRYPSVRIENRMGVGYRVVGPLPPHVERIAP